MKEKIKVLHFIPGFNFGGIEERFFEWCKYIDKEKIKFDLLVQTELDEKTKKRIEKYGCKIYKIQGINNGNIIKHIRDIRRVLKNNNYSIVHCHSADTSYFVLKYAAKHGVKCRILHSRTISIDGSSFIKLRMYLKKISLNKATDLFACSDEAGKWLLGNSSKEYRVLKNGIDLEKFYYRDNVRKNIREELKIGQSKLIGHIGRFSDVKNHKFIIEIFKSILDENLDYKLLLIGSGPTQNNIKDMVLKYNISQHVIFLDYQEDIVKYLNAMDIFVFPSKYEGFGTVLIEAQATGLKCLASKSVPEKTNILGMIKYLELDDFRIWKEAIINNKLDERRDCCNKIIQSGFSSKEIVNELQEFYLTR